MDSIELHQEAQAKKFREDVASKVEDILVRVDQKLNDYKDDRVYPILVATLLEEYDHDFQTKLIELYCFMYDLTWDFLYRAWELHDE